MFLTSITLLKEVINQLPSELFWDGKAHELHLTEQRLRVTWTRYSSPLWYPPIYL
jgi:hypothetical protein